eukprot:3234947-Pleurochrysis_carterae.AAC.2
MALFIKGYKFTLPAACLQEESLAGPLEKNELHTERWGVWQIAIWKSVEDEANLGCVARMRGGGGPKAWTGVMELPAVAGGFFNVTKPEGNEVMRRQIQEVLRKAGEEVDRGTERERADLGGVEVISVQQLYVSVKGMRTSAATNKCEFGYTTPSGEELHWGPTKFTLYAECHRRSHKVKTNTARTFHTVRGALILNEQKKWCELCAWAHGQDCQKLVAYREEEARRTQELMARAKRETAPTRAQLQAAKPEYTLSVEKKKQVRKGGVDRGKRQRERGESAPLTNMQICYACSGGSGTPEVRGGGQWRRRGENGAARGAERLEDADGLQRFPTSSWELPFLSTQVQLFSVQPPKGRNASFAQGHGTRRRKKGEDAGLAAGRQGRRRRGGRPQRSPSVDAR